MWATSNANLNDNLHENGQKGEHKGVGANNKSTVVYAITLAIQSFSLNKFQFLCGCARKMQVFLLAILRDHPNRFISHAHKLSFLQTAWRSLPCLLSTKP